MDKRGGYLLKRLAKVQVWKHDQFIAEAHVVENGMPMIVDLGPLGYPGITVFVEVAVKPEPELEVASNASDFVVRAIPSYTG